MTTVNPQAQVAKAVDSPATRFTGAMMREFQAVAGQAIELSPDQRRLAQHLFLKIDETLKALEFKRSGDINKKDKPEIAWKNINMPKLAIDAMRRIEIGLDALIDNHISPIPYLNGKTGQYDLDLRIGYAGKDYYKRRYAIDPPKDVKYELVYSTDKFKVVKKSVNTAIESYEFEITNPWDRGEIIGGFAYVVYEDPTKNQVILVSSKEFERSRSQGNADFWTKNPVEMRYKTIVNRAMAKLHADPEKTPASYHVIEAEYEAQDEERAKQAIDEGMAEIQTVDHDTGEIKGTTGEASGMKTEEVKTPEPVKPAVPQSSLKPKAPFA
jgi:recombination protein RecT